MGVVYMSDLPSAPSSVFIRGSRFRNISLLLLWSRFAHHSVSLSLSMPCAPLTVHKETNFSEKLLVDFCV